MDELIELYKKDIDQTLLRESLKLTTQERGERFRQFMELCFELRRAGESAGVSTKSTGSDSGHGK
ncbi:MAG: hypothetical protein AAGA03_14310 [Planctomycetota bacterium]